MPKELPGSNGKILCWIEPDQIEREAQQQLRNIASMPFIHGHVAVMPDVHLGRGATVGSVIATDGHIIPAAVGVDIGCGMIAVLTKFTANDLPDSLKKLRESIEWSIPLGTGAHNKELKGSAEKRYKQLTESPYYDRDRDYTKIARNWHLQIGSLGSGNHFIEICLDETNRVWAVLHSGSRGIGNQLAQRHINVAKGLMKKWEQDSAHRVGVLHGQRARGEITGDCFESGKYTELEHLRQRSIPLPDPDLAYLVDGSDEFAAYMRDLLWAQDYALLNREEMMDRVMKDLSYFFYNENGHQKEIELERIQCHHNFTQRENHGGKNVWVTRKGAIQMRKGQKGVIPGSMGTRSYIVSGLENSESFHSAPHGAGRRLSRTKAKQQFTMEDFDKAMQGIEHRRSKSLLDEIPGAYKNIDEVMENAKDLVRVEHELRQVCNVKGD